MFCLKSIFPLYFWRQSHYSSYKSCKVVKVWATFPIWEHHLGFNVPWVWFESFVNSELRCGYSVWMASSLRCDCFPSDRLPLPYKCANPFPTLLFSFYWLPCVLYVRYKHLNLVDLETCGGQVSLRSKPGCWLLVRSLFWLQTSMFCNCKVSDISLPSSNHSIEFGLHTGTSSSNL